MSRLSITIPGKPAPQGSKKAYVIKGRPVLVESSDALKPWRAMVTLIARSAANQFRWATTEDAVAVEITFNLLKPASSKREHPTVKPDIDKLVRAILDGLTEAGIWKDDSQVVDLIARKVYVSANPGVTATITTKDHA